MNIMDKVIKFIIGLIFAGFISSCGNVDETPPDGEITIAPSGWTYTVNQDPVGVTCAGAVIDPANTKTYEITAYNEYGSPMGNTSIEIAVGGLLALYDEFGVQLLPGADFRYVVTTDPNGTYTAYVAASTDCPYVSTLEAWSGTIYNNIQIAVVYEAPA